MKYGKQMRMESPPVRSFEGSIGKGKPYEGVNTIKEMGRSIHEIPRQDQSAQDMCKTPELVDRRVMEGSIPQVGQTIHIFQALCFSKYFIQKIHKTFVKTFASPNRFTLWASLPSSTMSSH